MISKTIVATFIVAGLASSGAMAAPKKRTDQRAATRALNEQQLAMATNPGAASMPGARTAMPAAESTMPTATGQVAPPAGEAMPMATPTDPAATGMTTPTTAVPPQ